MPHALCPRLSLRFCSVLFLPTKRPGPDLSPPSWQTLMSPRLEDGRGFKRIRRIPRIPRMKYIDWALDFVLRGFAASSVFKLSAHHSSAPPASGWALAAAGSSSPCQSSAFGYRHENDCCAFDEVAASHGRLPVLRIGGHSVPEVWFPSIRPSTQPSSQMKPFPTV